ncbi:MAG: hypothetical protein QNJ32_00330 [Xenococcaceae cyanobacterium MO_167.B27]|nr:hypothetical protein [Xenococcaceae cyanobacterium MO_167.B27]
MNSPITDLENSAEKNTQSSFKLIDQDHPELYWILSTSPQSKERFYFEYNFNDLIKGWFSVIPKYLLKRQQVHYAPLYYTRPEAETRKIDSNFAVVEIIWEEIDG